MLTIRDRNTRQCIRQLSVLKVHDPNQNWNITEFYYCIMDPIDSFLDETIAATPDDWRKFAVMCSNFARDTDSVLAKHLRRARDTINDALKSEGYPYGLEESDDDTET